MIINEWGKAIGFHDSAASVAIFSAPILFAFGLQFLPWKDILLLLGIACLILPFFFWRVSIEPQPKPSHRGSHYLTLFKTETDLDHGRPLVSCLPPPTWAYTPCCLFISLKKEGWNTPLPATSSASPGLGESRFRSSVGFFIDRYGYRKILFVGLLTTGLSTLSLSLAPTFSLLLITLFIQAALSLAFFPVGLAAIAKLTSPEERSMGIGAIISSGVIFGMGGAPLLLGIIADHFSFQVGILGMGVLTTLSSLMVRDLKDD